MQKKIYPIQAGDLPKVLQWLKVNSRWRDSRRYKRFEQDLRGERNPNRLLDDLFLNRRVFPSIFDFQREYYQRNRDWLDGLFRCDLSLKLDVQARLYRTVVAYVAELNAACLVAKFAPEGSLVWKGYGLDAHGVDFQLVLPDGRVYNFHVFVETPDAFRYRQQKRDSKGSDLLDGVHIDLPYSLDKDKPNGLVYFPSGLGRLKESYIQQTLDKILCV